MRLIRAEAELLVFLLRKQEYDVLRVVLARYPAIPPGHRQLSRTMSGEAAEENQRLLDEALAEQRAENQARLGKFLDEPGRFVELKENWRFKLKPLEANWLLQVLNEIRVGSWLRLGSPDFEAGVKVEWNEDNAPILWAMEVAGQFESCLLAALGVE